MLKLVFMAPRSGMDDHMNQMMNEIHAALGGDQDYAGYHEDWFGMKFRG